MIKNDFHIRQMAYDSADTGWGHINDDDLDSRFGTTDSFPERIKCISAFDSDHENNSAGDEVKNHGQIPMPFANTDFINSNLFELTELWARKTPQRIYANPIFTCLTSPQAIHSMG